MLAMKINKSGLRVVRNDQFSDLHSLKVLSQDIFGMHTAHAHAHLYSGVTDYVSEFTSDSIPPSATVAVDQDNYVIGSIRFPGGTFGNYYDWASEYISGPVGVYKEVFQKSNIYPTVAIDIALYGQPRKYSISSFVDYAKNYVPTAKIHVMMNVYTQSVAEIKAAIDKFRTALDDDSRVINWEMGNEMGMDGKEYETYVNDVAEPGSFPNLTGDDLARAFECYPEGRYSSEVQARKTAEACAHVRANYPDDKIGLSSHVIGRYALPSGLDGGNITRAGAWARAHQDAIPTENYDAVINHPYQQASEKSNLDLLAADSIPASGKELDASFTDQTDKIWRYHLSAAQEYARFSLLDMHEIWPHKEMWFTEWGILTHAYTTLYADGTCDTPAANKLLDATADFTSVQVGSRVLNSNTGAQAAVTVKDSTTLLTLDADIFQTLGHTYKIASENQPAAMAAPDQYILRSIYLASFAIAMVEVSIEWEGKTNITSNFHYLERGSLFTHGNYFSGHMNANGCAFALIRKTTDDMTQVSIPIYNDASVCFDGQDPYDHIKIHPVRALLLTNGTEQKLFIVNVSPTARTVEIPFATSSGRKIEAASSPADPFEQVPDNTYAVYTDLAASTVASSSMTIAPFSVHSLVNTGSLVDLNNFIMTVT